MSQALTMLSAGFRELLELLAPQPSDRDRILQRAQAGKCRAHDVVRVGRPDRLRQDVRDPRRLHNGADRSTRDDAGSVWGGLQQHAARAKIPDNPMRNGGPLQWHTNQVLLGGLDAFLDGRRHFLRLPDAEPDDSMAVAD